MYILYTLTREKRFPNRSNPSFVPKRSQIDPAGLGLLHRAHGDPGGSQLHNCFFRLVNMKDRFMNCIHNMNMNLYYRLEHIYIIHTHILVIFRVLHILPPVERAGKPCLQQESASDAPFQHGSESKADEGGVVCYCKE